MTDTNIAPAVEAAGIYKRFGQTIALHDAKLCVLQGETHALVGRNGAGKSTLVSVLTGLTAPDAGTVKFSGVAAPAMSDRKAWRSHVACVYQHSTIIPDLSVAENLFIGNAQGRGGFINWNQIHREAKTVLAQWGVSVSAEKRAGDLGIEDRQMVEIARSLSRGSRFIILDEPTAQLDGDEISRLFTKIQALQKAGVTFLFISHHLQEIYEICQTVTVMRDARHIVTSPVAQMPKNSLITAMTGETVDTEIKLMHSQTSPDAATILNVTALNAKAFHDINLTIRAGEVVGVAGATSSGRTVLAEVIAGLSMPEAGNITLEGKPLTLKSPKNAIEAGIGCIPKSRHKEGLILSQSVVENATMTIASNLGPCGFQLPKIKQEAGERAIQAFDIKTQGNDQPVSGLSGGNQQKVVMARALANNPKLLVLIDPTVGVDVKSKQALLNQIDACRQDGKAILLSSTEIEDLRVCDLVHVMVHGRIVKTFEAGWNETELIASMEGIAVS